MATQYKYISSTKKIHIICTLYGLSLLWPTPYIWSLYSDKTFQLLCSGHLWIRDKRLSPWCPPVRVSTVGLLDYSPWDKESQWSFLCNFHILMCVCVCLFMNLFNTHVLSYHKPHAVCIFQIFGLNFLSYSIELLAPNYLWEDDSIENILQWQLYSTRTK